MSEMLGNQFFMARNYSAAQKEFEEVILKNKTNKSLKKKLIVCYTQTGNVNEAILVFNDLIAEDIEFIINTNAELDDCPCPELIEKIEGQKDSDLDQTNYNLMLGIIWLYCDINKSVEYLIKARETSANNINIDFAIQTIQSHKNAHFNLIA